jgi:hypothetical protein
MKYFLKQAQFSRTSIASSWHGREDGNLYQVAVVETVGPKGACFFSIFDNQNGPWQVVPFPTRLIFAGDKMQGVVLLKQRYSIDYRTPEKKRTVAP